MTSGGNVAIAAVAIIGPHICADSALLVKNCCVWEAAGETWLAPLETALLEVTAAFDETSGWLMLTHTLRMSLHGGVRLVAASVHLAIGIRLTEERLPSLSLLSSLG